MRLLRYGRAIEQLGQRYRLDGALGSGGMADVCLAWDELEQREVAIKVIKPEGLDQRMLDRFLKEIAQVMKLHHPHILHMYSGLNLELLDVAHGSIVPYIVMEYAEGGDLQKRLHSGQAYPLAKTLALFEELCSAVQYAHNAGVIHRDLKPLNILFRRLPNGVEETVLGDFGLAVEIDATHHTFASGGTLAYMAPEQFQGHAQAASDIFALGVILYQLGTGRLPFRRSLQDLRRVGPLEPPPRPSTLNPDLPPALDEVILTALAEDPAQRFPRAELLWQHVQAAIDTTTFKRSPDIVRSRFIAPPDAIGPRSIAPPDPAAQPYNSQHPTTSIRTDISPFQAGGTTSAVPTTPVARNTLPRTNTDMSGGPMIVELPSPRRRATQSPPTTPFPGASAELQTRPSGKMPAPPRQQRTVPRLPLRPSRWGQRSPRLDIALVLIPLLLVVVAVLYKTGSLNALWSGGAGVQTANTITITPDSKIETDSYLVSAVTGTPDVAQRQVQARLLSSSAQSQPQTVQATGMVQTAGQQASGVLTFYNGSGSAFTVGINTTIHGSDGIAVALDANVTIPAGNPPTEGSTTVSAHAVNIGSNGNIAKLDINGTCCASGGFIVVKNLSAFTGGTDTQNYTVVRQSDISGVSDAQVPTLTQQAQANLHKQLASNERLGGASQCTASTSANPAAGTKATTATVQVTVSCSASAYDQGAVETLATSLLTATTATTLGANFPSYALVDQQGHKTTLVATTTTVNSVTNHALSLLVKASGVWVYQFSDGQKQHLKTLVAGKTMLQATMTLKGLAGIVAVSTRPDGGTLPTNLGQITINAAIIHGFAGGEQATPAVGQG